MIKRKNPVEISFINWVTLNPDSFHHLDMKRFYVFVHSVIRYNAKSWNSYNKFKQKILLYKPNFSNEAIDYYFNLMHHILDFSKESYLPLYDIDDKGAITIQMVENGKIINKIID